MPPDEGSASELLVPPPLELDELLPPLEDEDEDDAIETVHGGTITRWRSELSGMISWFWPCEDWFCCCVPALLAPPGLRTTVPEPLALCVWPSMQGCTATVWASEALGTTTWLEPGGIAVLSCETFALAHGGTTIVRSPRCLGITIVRTPGADSAMATGSGGMDIMLELDELPHPLAAIAAIPSAIPARVPLPVTFISFSPSLVTASPGAAAPEKRLPRERGRVNGRRLACFRVWVTMGTMRAGLGRVRLPEARTTRVFLGLLVAGALLRLVFFFAWRPAFMGWPDAKSYIDVAHGDLFGNVLRPAGYPLFLRGLEVLVPDIRFVILVNHALGLATAALLYAAVTRATGSRALGLLPAAIVALGGDGMFLEHSPLSEPLFTFLVAVALYAAVRATDGGSLGWPALAGLSLACATSVRVVGLALLPLVVIWLLFAVPRAPLRRRLLTAAAGALAGFAVLGAYCVAEYHAEGEWGLSRNGDWHLYGRVAPFADCTKFTPPPGTAALCEST
ncbi:MAG: hypothetical protein QOJ07_2316, partial [Thermoleophilaceae bacterium]|nr:hypothetical protein [Thermoleophilaceae bacterium]